MRLSIGAQIKQMPPPMLSNRKTSLVDPVSEGPEAEILSQLEKSRQEYENLKKEKEDLERSKQEAHLENTIEMRETIELLKEEALFKNELLTKYEKQQKKTEQEVSPLTPNGCLDQLLQEAELRDDEAPGGRRETPAHAAERVRAELQKQCKYLRL